MTGYDWGRVDGFAKSIWASFWHTVRDPYAKMSSNDVDEVPDDPT